MVSGSSPTKSRRTRSDVDAIKAAIVAALLEDSPMTVRQVFYRLVSAGSVAKTEMEYKATVVRLLTSMRLSGEIPFGSIADNTRWMRKPTTHHSLESALLRTAEAYRRSLWDNQDAYVEVWLEKDALAGVLVEVTSQWDVPLMVTRGYPSLTYLYEMAELLSEVGKPSFLYYFGDYDPSGLDIPRNVEARIREFAPSAEIHFERVAVTSDQILSMSLPTRPTKKADTRSKGFEGESVEVDAIPPKQLRALVSDCITRHVDPSALQAIQATEQHERLLLNHMVRQFQDSD